MKPKLIVAQRSRMCRICTALPAEAVADVNATIWPEPGASVRARNYRMDATRAAAAHGLEIEAKTVSRHARHVEASWHKVTAVMPAAPGEVPVFPVDYASMADQAAQVGAHAMKRIGERIGVMDDRELVAVAKMGVTTATQREALRMKAQEVDQNGAILRALMGTASGLIDPADLPDVEVIDVTPVGDLLDVISQEREALKRLAAGEGEAVGAR